MDNEALIAEERIIGIFRGFSEGGLEFHADLILPYRPDYHIQPMHGQFLLVQLTDPYEAVLGRITALRSEGRLVDAEGEDYLLRQVVERRPIPEDMRDQYLKFRVNIRVLGVLRREESGTVTFVPSHRRLPHVGSPVALPSPRVLRAIAGHDDSESAGAALGFLAMGEFVWAQQENHQPHPDLQQQSWMRLMSPSIVVRFPVNNLVARRTFIFAQSGFGKSNLVKLLFSELYRRTPQIQKRGGRMEPVGTLIFDRDGEYFWPDDKGRPGLCDVPHLRDQLVVFTDRQPPSAYYGAFIASNTRLDIRRLSAGMVISIALSPEKQDQQNVRKLKGLPADRWKDLVDTVHQYGMNAPLSRVQQLLGMSDDEGNLTSVEANAARSNLYTIVRMLHDPNSRLLDMLDQSLRAGKICVVDLSRLASEAARILAALILQYLFERNQEEFIRRDAATIPVIAVLEEAQSVLSEERGTAHAPFVTWVKEGRKYDLGAVMITQQPGSIPPELLSQGDVWFVFHLLSEGDLKAVQRANAHFSSDLLATLLNEPIPGHCIFWSSAGGKPYPLPLRILSFETRYQLADPTYSRAAISTYAQQLRDSFRVSAPAISTDEPSSQQLPSPEDDYLTRVQEGAIQQLRHDADFIARVQRGEPIGWGELVNKLQQLVRTSEPSIPNHRQIAYTLVRVALERFFGLETEGAWHTERVDGRTMIVIAEERRIAFLQGLHNGQSP
jgi:DNA helicase HerA-like ATPase